MQKLKAMQEQKKKQEAAPTTTENGTTSSEAPATETKPASGGVFSLKNKAKATNKKGARQNAAELRAQKDISEMAPVPGAKVHFPDADNLMKFEVFMTPSDGLYSGATFTFIVEVPNTYPYDPPRVTCSTLVYHPNIDFDGKVCLNILRQDWMPVLSLGSVIFGLMTLFLEPNPDDPLNKEAAQLMIDRPKDFERNVKEALRGGTVAGRKFTKIL